MINVAKPYLTEGEAQGAYETILSGWVAQGPRVQEFEEKFASYVGSKYAVATTSCTTALHLALIVAGIKPGDEVICPSMSFIATANAIVYAGARPVFAEIEPETYNIDVKHAESLITPKTRAIMIVHQIGLPADIDAFQKLSAKYNLKLIEDAACAAGSAYKGKKIGAHSELVCFSFHPRKVITTGEGGMITTSNKDYNERLRILRHHGMAVTDWVRHRSDKVIIEDYLEVGYNYRMNDIQAAVGIKQLEKLDWLVSERRKIAQRYNEAFQEIPCIRLPQEKESYFTNYQSYSIYLKKEAPILRNELMQKLLDQGIATRRGVMTIHREPAYKNLAGNLKLPATEETADRSLLLPLYVPMAPADLELVISQVKKFLAG